MANVSSNTAEDRFTSTDLAIASGLSPRNVLSIQAAELLPPALSGPGPASAKLYDIAALNQATLVGALYLGGMELFPAARLGAVVAAVMADRLGGINGNIAAVWTACGKPELKDTSREYWFHKELYSQGLCPSNIYYPGDFFFELVNRSFVLLGITGEMELHCSLSTTGQRGDPFVPVPLFLHDDVQALEQRAEEERANALAILRVNVSLAVRVGLDRLQQHRIERAAIARLRAAKSRKPLPTEAELLRRLELD